MIFSTAAVSGLALMAAGAADTSDVALDVDSRENIDILTVTGVRQDRDIAGAVTVLDAEELGRFDYSDVNRVLRAVPGINLQEEDGYGLRPNIGLRGSGTDRSSKVLILEDGVPMAPAPFAAPSAYYFPTVTRMNAIEVTKGAGTVKYGPVTTAGTIHFFSTPIPEDAFSGEVTAMVSDLDRTKIHAFAGGRGAVGALPFDAGVLIETVQEQADGFKDLDGGGDTGFDLEDYVAKIGFFSKAGAATEQSLVLKYQTSDESSDETYLGLTEADFEATPFRRYRASANDVFNADHETWQATHNAVLGNGIEWTTIAYRTEFARNWEKLDRFDNSALSGLAECSSLNGILMDPTTCDAEFEVLVGAPGYVSPDDVLGIRQNNRAYEARGIQSAVQFGFAVGSMGHEVTVSARYHEDEVDRFQEQDQYRIDNGEIILTTDNAPGTQANRLSDATAKAIYLEDRIEAGPWGVVAGLRYERIETEQQRWNTPDRTLPADSVRENTHDVVLPSLGVTYDLNDRVQFLAGISKGYAVPSPSTRSTDGTDPEESIAYEAGIRFEDGPTRLEAIGFYNDYSNLLAECTNSSGGSECVIGDSENAGEANVWGLELVAGSAATAGNIEIPFGLVYTYTSTELQSTVASDIFGAVTAGDEVPYTPEHQLTASVGIEANRWGGDLSANYVSEARAVPGQGEIPADERIDARTLVDAAAWFDATPNVRLLLQAQNLFDEEYLAARRPYGLRPGKPREVLAGVKVNF